MRQVIDNLTFNSDFDSGNLMKVEKNDKGEYELWINSDGWEFGIITNVTGGEIDQVITLKVVNLNKQSPLYSNDYRVIQKTVPTDIDWKRSGPVIHIKEENTFSISWNYIFESSSVTVYFAFCYPYSYETIVAYMNNCDFRQYSGDYSSMDMYYNRELLIYTPERRRIDLLTISSSHDKIVDQEELIDDLFPEGMSHRPMRYPGKPVVFVSARVHPGETPGSYMMEGFLNFIMSKDKRAEKLRNIYLFKVVPVINPDGVARGYYRTDIYGENLNRFYDEPNLEKQPAIYAIKKLLEYHSNKGNLYLYLDYHAHASKRAIFTYGNHCTTLDEQIDNLLFISLMYFFKVIII